MVRASALARAAADRDSLRVELPQHRERAPVRTSAASLPLVPSVLAPPPCSARSPPTQLQVTLPAQATPRAKAPLSESVPRKRPAAADQVKRRWATQPVGGCKPGGRLENRRRRPTHPTRPRPRR